MKKLIENLKFAWKYTKSQKRQLIKFIICNIMDICISIIVPILSAKIIINLTNNMLEQLLLVAIVIFVVEISRNVFNIKALYYSQIIYREGFINIQTDIGKEIVKIENSCIDKNGSGVFIQRLTNDASKLADVFNVINIYLTNIITDIGILFTIFLIDKIIFIFIIIMLIILYIVEHKRVLLHNEKDKEYREENEKVSSFVSELVRGIRDIKMLNAEKSFINELHNKVKLMNKDKYEIGLIDRKYSFLRGCINDIMDLGVIIIIIYLISKNELQIASALIIYNYLRGITSIIYYVGTLLEQIKNFNLSATRVFEVIKEKTFKKEKFGTKHLDNIKGNFEFKNVDFKYDENSNYVLKNLSFKINSCETVSFVGKTGAGKSTIFSLLCKMYDINNGSIMIDNENIENLDKDSIRGNITIINQNPYIFNISIKENLKLVKEDLTEEEMIKACKLACLDDFINTLPNGYDTIVGEGGVTLSGGQRQRLAIARAFVQKTKIILFDEATSALDNETQQKIQQAINNLKKDYTILIIAHRLSTVIGSDRIMLLDNGKIIATGKHQELLRKCIEYKKLYESELQKKK